MEKRVILAMLLSLVVLVVYQILIGPPPPAQPQPGAAQDANATGPAQPGKPAPASTPAPAAPAPAQTPAAPTAPAAALVVGDTAARDIVVDADAFVATFTSAGAALKSWRLKKHLLNDGQPLELVPPDLTPGQYPLPFTLQTDDVAQTTTLAAALYRPSHERLTLGSGPGTLRFQYQDASGLASQKTFYFQPNGHPYEVTVEASIDAAGLPKPVAIVGGAGIGMPTPAGSTPPQLRVVQFIGAVQRIVPTSLQPPTYEGAMHFAGVDDHYFLIAAVPRGAATRVDYAPLGTAGRTLVGFTVRPKAESSPSSTVKIAFYLGPKEIDHLLEVDPMLMNAIDFGMFRWLVRPLLRSLKWINQYVHNYGWSIIILTVVINVVIFPLRHKSMVSMRKMQTLQPQLKAIQDRYKNLKFTDPDRQKMNSETMALYKQHGVNPASGCVPMLLTMPILFAFYAMLSVAIELRGAPFGGWIHDLAAKDPLYITPIIMGATMFWQQRMMPSTADPTQQKIFLMLPLVFTIMFLQMPAGLVLYWTASNLLAIGQQTITNRLIAAPARPARPVRKA